MNSNGIGGGERFSVPSRGNTYMQVAAFMSFVAAIAHVAIILGGPSWYRFFGAGEQMAQLAENGDPYPAIVTAVIAGVLFTWGLFALSAAGTIKKLPFTNAVIIIITGIYISRGLGFLAPWLSDSAYIHELGTEFWWWSSMICLFIGITHLLGLKQVWSRR